MKELIRRRALELGFQDCRFTTAEAPASAGHFRAWLKSGRHGEMRYLERSVEKRADLGKVLEGVQSLVVLAAAYPAGGRGGAAGSGVVARYARGGDYHEVLREPLAALSAWMDELGGAATRSLWYVDTGPILERDLAQRAGLGFVGKHTGLLSRGLGNWFFIAEILTTLKLEPDAPEKNRCGNCSRCIGACPTGAITGPFQLDARRCISYLTIELKGPIPEALRPAMGDRIFGCDDCLEACPWNRFARDASLLGAHARDDLKAPRLLELLELDEPAFKARFRDTPLMRSKRRGLLRNVCVALGNVANADALPALGRASLDPEPLIAEHARWAVGRIEARDRGMEV